MKNISVLRALRTMFLGLTSTCVCQPSLAGPIVGGTFYQFGFTDPGVAASGCQPDDPAGIFCLASSGAPTLFADSPAWTFNAPASGAVFSVLDAFTNGEQFEVFDFGASLGLTSLPAGASDCGDDPVPCLADPAMSKGDFNLAAGAHSLTIVSVLSPDGLGSGYFIVDNAVVTVDEPGSVALALLGLLGIMTWRYRSARVFVRAPSA